MTSAEPRRDVVGRTDWQREEYKDPEARGSVAGVRKEGKCGWASGKGLGEGRRRCRVAGPGLIDGAQRFRLSPAVE